MNRGQTFILITMSIIIIILFSGVAVLGMSLTDSETPASGDQAEIAAGPPPKPTATPTPSATPTFPFTPTPTDTPIPTPTSTRVVNNTATPTPSKTPTPAPPTATPTNTPVSRSNYGISSSSVGSFQSNPAATPVPTSRYPFRVVEGPLDYKTKNHFLVILAKVTAGGAFLPNYKLVGFHSPTGRNWESLPSCNHICKASGPPGVHDDEGELIERFLIQEGNIFIEFPFYEDGVFTFMLVDPQGRQASEVLQLELDSSSDNRKWFYLHFSR
ncbi:MAG: hypothetical protein GWO38_05805 [Phycisphaerae bacterium]|nr:hypothetical protein [Phycisphaerae bacterium]NIX27149.1 hypothetical protein [Phycisphaerae bacterium]